MGPGGREGRGGEGKGMRFFFFWFFCGKREKGGEKKTSRGSFNSNIFFCNRSWR